MSVSRQALCGEVVETVGGFLELERRVHCRIAFADQLGDLIAVMGSGRLLREHVGKMPSVSGLRADFVFHEQRFNNCPLVRCAFFQESIMTSQLFFLEFDDFLLNGFDVGFERVVAQLSLEALHRVSGFVVHG